MMCLSLYLSHVKACRCRNLEVSSSAGVHLKATASQSSIMAVENASGSKDHGSGLSRYGSTLKGRPAGNMGLVQSPEKGTDEFWMHPAVGDCIIHLGAVPLTGQNLVTRSVILYHLQLTHLHAYSARLNKFHTCKSHSLSVFITNEDIYVRLPLLTQIGVAKVL